MTSVTIIVPCRNEKSHISAFLDGILQQDFSGLEWDLIVADGESDDGTTEVIREYSGRERRIQLIHNPGRIVSSGLNLAILAATGEVIVRMDVHTAYAPDYVRKCLEALQRSGAQCVGGPWRARGISYLSRAIAAAFQSAFSAGGARSHDVSYQGFVDSVYLGCWKRSTLVSIGMFDEALVRNQDDELNLRITQAGGRVWQAADILSWYTPRASLRALFRQYFQYGFWKIAVIRKHRRPASLRHLVPGLFVAGMAALLITTTIAELLAPRTAPILLGLLSLASATYLLAGIAAAIVTGMRAGLELIPVLPAVFVCFHFGYGSGFLYGLWHWRGSARTAPARAVTELTR